MLEGGLRRVDGRVVVTKTVEVRSHDRHHDHLVMQAYGVVTEDTLQGMRDSKTLDVDSRFPCKTAVLLIANDRRVYEFVEADRKHGLGEAIEYVTAIQHYLMEAAGDPGKKLHLDLVEDESRGHGLGAIGAAVLAIIVLFRLTGWERLVVDANGGTLTIIHGGALPGWVKVSESVCGIDNLVKVEVVERESLSLDGAGRGVRNETNYFLVVYIAGLGAKKIFGEYDGTLEFAGVFGDPGEIKKASEAINNLLIGEGKNGGEEMTQENEIVGAGIEEGDVGLCVVCLTKRANTVCMPCKHLRCCSGCLERLEACPICREVIKEKVLVYV